MTLMDRINAELEDDEFIDELLEALPDVKVSDEEEDEN